MGVMARNVADRLGFLSDASAGPLRPPVVRYSIAGFELASPMRVLPTADDDTLILPLTVIDHCTAYGIKFDDA